MYMPLASPHSKIPPSISGIRQASRALAGSSASVTFIELPTSTTLLTRAETGPLPQRDPAEQHDRPDDDRDRADRQPGVRGDALVQHVPRIEAEPGANLKRARRPVQRQPEVEHHDPPSQAAGAPLRVMFPANQPDKAISRAN